MKSVPLLVALLLLIPAAPAAGQDTSAVKDMLGNLWARLRAATPRSTPAAPAASVTAGLRGAEATESELNPTGRATASRIPARAPSAWRSRARRRSPMPASSPRRRGRSKPSCR